MDDFDGETINGLTVFRQSGDCESQGRRWAFESLAREETRKAPSAIEGACSW